PEDVRNIKVTLFDHQSVLKNIAIYNHFLRLLSDLNLKNKYKEFIYGGNLRSFIIHANSQEQIEQISKNIGVRNISKIPTYKIIKSVSTELSPLSESIFTPP